MQASKTSARPVRIRVDEIQVNGSGGIGIGTDAYQLDALGEEYALFRKISRSEEPGRLPETQSPSP